MNQKSPNLALGTGLFAAIGASICCVLPLALVTAGLGGAWMASLRIFEPIRPLFILVAVIALALAHRQIFSVPENCEPEQACANPAVQKRRKLIFWSVGVVVLLLLASPYLIAMTA